VVATEGIIIDSYLRQHDSIRLYFNIEDNVMKLNNSIEDKDKIAWLQGLLGQDFLLWTPNLMEQGFLNWDQIFATRVIKSAGSKKSFIKRTQEINPTYGFLDRKRDVNDLMKDEHLSGVLVLHKGDVILERYALGLAPDKAWQSSSVVKSLTSILIGAAIHDGYINSLDDVVPKFLPEFQGTIYEQVTLRDLLTMCSGAEFTENYENLHSNVAADYIRPIAERKKNFILDRLKKAKRINPPGKQFAYNTGDTFLLSHILTRATGKHVADYCSERVWIPMEMDYDGYFMLDSDNGFEITGSCCGATLRDYARLGQLMLNDGVAANGERIVPEGWVAESTAPCAPNFNVDFWPAPYPKIFGYGYFWWVIRPGSFTAIGVYGQWIHVEPESGVVVVMIGAMPRDCYMNPSEPAAVLRGAHDGGLGTPSRLAFIDAAIEACR